MQASNPTIRTITLHLTLQEHHWSNARLQDSLSQAQYVLETLSRNFEEKGFTVWSTRLTLPPPPPSVEVSRLAEIRDQVKQSIFVSLGGFMSDDPRVEELDQLIANNLFAYIAVKDTSHLETLTQTLLKWSLDQPSNMVRLGVEFTGKKDFMTPYFPISATPEAATRSRYTIAFLYPNWIMSHMKMPTLKELETMVADAVTRVNRVAETPLPGLVDFGGVDTSLSPWMKDSVARLLELIGRCRLETYDCIPALSDINSVLMRHGTVGFNEVMLPVGEDDVLKQKVQQGKLALEDLITLLPFCLAGLDMVALALNATELYSLLKTLRTIALWKKRVMGFRAILLPPDYPDDGIELNRFGFIPVLKKREELKAFSSDKKEEGGPLIIP